MGSTVLSHHRNKAPKQSLWNGRESRHWPFHTEPHPRTIRLPAHEPSAIRSMKSAPFSTAQTGTHAKRFSRDPPPGVAHETQLLQENAHGRRKSTSNAGHPGLDRVDQQRNGPHRPRRVSLAHL